MFDHLQMHSDISCKLPDGVDAFEYLSRLPGKNYRAIDGRRTALCMVGGNPYFLKTHVGVGWREIIKNLIQLRLPVISAKTEFIALKRMQELEIESMDCVAFGERGFNPATRRSLIITRALENTLSLEELMFQWQKVAASSDGKRLILKRKLILKLADIARTLHQNGVNHRDFYLCHFLLPIENAASGNLTKLFLIDLHRAQIRQSTPARWQIKDLAGLYFSAMDAKLTRNDRLRFICRYHQTDLATALNNESLWDAVALRATKTYREFHNNPFNT